MFFLQVRDLSDCPPSYPSSNPKPLTEVGLLTKCHTDAVLSTAFSPFHFTLVSGCMAGKIVWHQPML
jgi:WD repeat-containing protein 32